MNKLVAAIERRQSKFEKISNNNYMMAIKDGFIAVMPLVLFSSFLLLIVTMPKTFGFEIHSIILGWLQKVYSLTMGMIGLVVAGTVAKHLALNFNRTMPAGKVINGTSTLIAAICSFLVLTVTLVTDKKTGATTIIPDYLGAQGLMSSFVAAFITVNLYRFCVKRNLTIRLPKEVPGAIAQAFKDVFPFCFSVLACGGLDVIARNVFNVPFAQAFQKILSPLFKGVESYPGMMLIWFTIALLWFVGIHGPSVVLPAITAIQFANFEANAAMLTAGQTPTHALTPNFGNYIPGIGGTGATFVVPFIFMFLMRSKQLKTVGKASFIPVIFAVNEPLLFATPIILNPYFFIPFLLAPTVNVVLGKFFIDVLGMAGFPYNLPWSLPGPLGILLNTNFQPIAFVFIIVLLTVDVLIYLPFCRAYDKVMQQKELVSNAESQVQSVKAEKSQAKLTKETKVLVLCAGSGTSAQLAEALNTGAQAKELPLVASAGAYGSHAGILASYDMVVLAPQVRSYYNELKKDTDKLGIKLVATRGMEYIELTNDPEEAVAFILEKIN